MTLKNALAIIVALSSVTAFAKQVNVACTSQSAQVSGALDIQNENVVYGDLSINGTTTKFSGRYSYYPAGTFCKASDVGILSIATAATKDHTYAVKSVKGDTCGNSDADVIYVNGKPEQATCTVTIQ